MPIPALDARGLLPGGVHIGTLREIEQRFLFNQHRSDLYHQVKIFLEGELREKAFGLQLILGGSFFSDKEHPADIEDHRILAVSYGYSACAFNGAQQWKREQSD
jgi:hypothetical protein